MKPTSVRMNIDTGEKTWLTPPHIIEALGPFDLDPCCPPTMPWRTATQMVCRPDDGLSVDWNGRRVWCNPPYGREATPFLERMAHHTGGGILLMFARTETAQWQDLVFPHAHAVMFLRGRLRFCHPDGTQGDAATAPSAFVSYSHRDTIVLGKSGLRGRLMLLIS